MIRGDAKDVSDIPVVVCGSVTVASVSAALARQLPQAHAGQGADVRTSGQPPDWREPATPFRLRKAKSSH